MAYDKVIDSSALDAGMTATANAIRAKTGGSSPIAWDASNGFKVAVEKIETGVERPELNEPAEPGEVFSGKEYIDGSGQKKTGSFTIDEELTEQDTLIAQIANALKDKAAGSLVSLPELGDTAAKPTDMAAGKVLYDDDGNPVAGTIYEVTEGIIINSTGDTELHSRAGSTEISVSGIYYASDIGNNTIGAILRPGSKMKVNKIPSSLFGNAARNQVAKGVTFTSEPGLLEEGELEEIVAGKPLCASENIIVNRNSDGTITIVAKTNFGDNPDVIVRNGAYLMITVSESDFDGIFGGTGDVTIDGETLVFGANSTATIENDTLIL